MTEVIEKLTIDGREVTALKGTSILDAAETAGIHIPHFCYHPHLTLAGNCRMCLVEIEKVPKLQISCGTPIREGMVVSTNSERVRQARKAILEFQLVNHPTECPICDKAGECKLQDYYMDYSLESSEVSVGKIGKSSRLKELGGDVVHNDERCITCLRCVRFLSDVTKTGELAAIGRGDHTEIDIFPDKPIANYYSGCIVDVCPVGAMTSKDFRFKKRVWYLTKAESICPGCSRGCNINVEFEYGRAFSFEPRPGQIYRVTPRRNDEVNHTFLCDPGRFLFHKFQGDRLLVKPLLKEREKRIEVTMTKAVETAAARIKTIGADLSVWASPFLTNEELYLVAKIADGVGCTRRGSHLPEVGAWAEYQDEVLIRKDKNPNSRGAFLLGFGAPDGGAFIRNLVKSIDEGMVKHLLIVGGGYGRELDDLLVESLPGLETLIVINWARTKVAEAAELFIPGATWYEKSGTFTNFEGRVQVINECFPPSENGHPEWRILAEILEAIGQRSFASVEDVYDKMAEEIEAFSGTCFNDIGSFGIVQKELEKTT